MAKTKEERSAENRKRYFANLEENRKKNSERMRISYEAKRQARFNDPSYQEILAQREAEKKLRPEKKARAIATSKSNRKARAVESTKNKLPPHQRKYRRGFVREDGMVFWRYQWDQFEHEKWVTQEYYDKKAPIEREKALTRAAIKPSNPPKRETQRRWAKWKNENDPLFALKHRCRSRIQAAIRLNGWKKPCKTSAMLGCDWPTLKLHIEQQFLPKMNWGNRNLWHIDHYHPLDDAKNMDEVMKLSHYTNLRPMWAKDNQKKSSLLCPKGHQIPLLLQ